MMPPQPTTSVMYRTLRIVESAHTFFLFGTLLTGGLFVAGNYQEFLDASQILLLQILSVMGVLCGASGLWYAGGLVIWMVRRRKPMLVRLFASMLSSLIGAAGVLLAGAFQAVSGMQ